MREVLTYSLSDAAKVTLRPATPDDAAGDHRRGALEGPTSAATC